MAQTVELVPLVCPKCSNPIRAEVDEVAWQCAQCEQGVMLDEKTGLVPIEIQFAANLASTARGNPFWVADGRVTLRRESFKGDQDREAAQFWSQPRRFLVPAFACNLESVLGIGMAMLRKPPVLQPGGPRVPFASVVLSRDDVLPVAEFIVMAVEAERSDFIKEIHFQLTLSEPALWVLP